MTQPARALLAVSSAGGEDAALEDFYRNGWTDGLPVVIPTPERVEQMLLWSPDLDSDVVLGNMGPSEGEATVAKVAVNAVMAGCRPEYFPVVLAAVEAILEPVFNLGPMQSTTHCVTPIVIVNGPVRDDLEIASGLGALGPGYRANATIGRALRLVMMNVGGGHVGVGDMAIFGSPAKYSMCVAEAEAESPFPPLHVARGLAAELSAVTVVPVEGPHMVVSVLDGDDVAGSARRLISALALALANPSSLSVYLGQGSVVVLLNPDHARCLADAGLSRDDVVTAIWQQATARRGFLRGVNPVIVTGEAGPADDQLHYAVTSPERIVLAVCGGGGTYSTVFPTWAAPAELCLAVTKPVRETGACDI